MVPAIPITALLSPVVQQVVVRVMLNMGLNILGRVVNNRIQGTLSDNAADELLALKNVVEQALLYDTGDTLISTAESLKSINEHLEAIRERMEEGFEVPLTISLDMDGTKIAEWNWEYSR